MGVDLSKAGPETVGKSLYEGMFLVDSAEAAADWDAVVTTIRNVLERAEAEIVSIRKWDERRLVYKINGKTRGTYILCYFRVAGTRIQEIERNIQLSMAIWRVLILNTEQQTEADIEKETPAMLVEKQQLAESAAESAPLKQSDDKEETKETETKETEAGQPDGAEQAQEARESEKKVTEPEATEAAEPELAADASEDHQGQRQAGADEDVEQQDSAEATAG